MTDDLNFGVDLHYYKHLLKLNDIPGFSFQMFNLPYIKPRIVLKLHLPRHL